MQNWCHTTHQRCNVKFMEFSSTMQGVDYKENRKKKAKAYTEARPTIHHDLFLAFLLKMSLNFVLRAANL